MAKVESNPAEITTGWYKRFLADPFTAGDRIYSDTISERKALELRVIGRRAAWVSRYKGTTTIGYAAVAKGIVESKIVTPQEARGLNEIVRGLKDREPELVKLFLTHYFSALEKTRRDARTAMAAAEEDLARARGEEAHSASWTLQQAVDNWIEKRSRSDNKKPIKDTYAAEVRMVFGRDEFAEVIELPITKLTSRMAEDIRDDVLENSGVSMAKKAVRGFRQILSYTYKNHRGQSGMESHQPWWLMLTEDSVIAPKEREPSIDDIGKVLALGEYFLDHRLPGRTGVQHGVRDNVFSAFLWIMLSAQRVTSALALQHQDIMQWTAEGEKGWFQAMWRKGVMKNRKRFVLPIPPYAADALTFFMVRAKHIGSTWAFPSEDGDDAQIDRSAPLNFMRRLAGREDENGVDLFELNGIEYWSPHDVRRALTTCMEAAGIPGGASVVLSHTIDLGEPDKKMSDAQFEIWARNRVAKITGESYGDIQHLKLKGDAMVIWTSAVLAAWDKARNSPLYVDKDKTVIVSEHVPKWTGTGEAAA